MRGFWGHWMRSQPFCMEGLFSFQDGVLERSRSGFVAREESLSPS
jgi:hypothetical protein